MSRAHRCNRLKSLSRLHEAETLPIDNLSSLWWSYLNASFYGSGIMISLNNIGAGETEAIKYWSLYHGVYTMEFILEFIQNAPQSAVQEAKIKLIMITKISSDLINIWLLVRLEGMAFGKFHQLEEKKQSKTLAKSGLIQVLCSRDRYPVQLGIPSLNCLKWYLNWSKAVIFYVLVHVSVLSNPLKCIHT